MVTRKSETKPLTGRKEVLRIRDFMHPDPLVIDAGATLDEAEVLMEEYGVRHLPVEDEHILAGVVSDRDLSNGRARGFLGHSEVRSVMTAQPYYVDPDTELSAVLEIMASNRLGCVIIKDAGENIRGIFTTTDAVRILARLVTPG